MTMAAASRLAIFENLKSPYLDFGDYNLGADIANGVNWIKMYAV